MVTVAGAYGSHSISSSYCAAEPPGVIEVRSVLESVLAEARREFVNRSVRATALGFKELDSGQYVTLEALEEQILKK